MSHRNEQPHSLIGFFVCVFYFVLCLFVFWLLLFDCFVFCLFSFLCFGFLFVCCLVFCCCWVLGFFLGGSPIQCHKTGISKGRDLCCPMCGKMHIKDYLIHMGKTSVNNSR